MAESRLGTLVAVLAAFAWIAAMSVTDETACSLLPVLAVLGIALAIGLAGMLSGYKVVKTPWLAWLVLFAGCGYAARAVMGYSLVEGWRDAGFVLGALVFYLVGLQAGQGNGSKGVAAVLMVALLANMAAMGALQWGDFSMLWLGRPDEGLFGINSRHVTLFLYKNFSALFLLLSGGILFWRAVWEGKWGFSAVASGVIGLAGVGLSFCCFSRLPFLLVPLLAAAGWVIWIIIRLCSKGKLGWGSILAGMSLLVAVLIAVYDFLFGNSIIALFSGVDTHLRFLIWKYICQVLPDAPLWGYGAGASQWEIIPAYEEWNAPNYAHNEYLQMWCDYGPLGIGVALLLLFAHMLQGACLLGSESPGEGRRIKAAMALLALVGLSLAAASDFVWHHFSLLGMGAFACGILASPYPHAPMRLFDRRHWAPGCGPGVRPVQAQGAMGRVFLGAFGLVLLAAMVKLGALVFPAWALQWQYGKLVSQGAGADARRALLGQAVEVYPDSRIMDNYVMLPVAGKPDWAEMERLLRRTLQANPRQLFTVTMLGTVLGRQARFEEAERLYRRYYPGTGPDNRNLTNWGAYYGLNLLQWGQQALSAGELEKGYSLLRYGTRVCSRQGFFPGTTHRGGMRCWTEGGNAAHHRFIKSCSLDLATLEQMGIREDASWQRPFAPGEKPALYARYGLPEEIGKKR